MINKMYCVTNDKNVKLTVNALVTAVNAQVFNIISMSNLINLLENKEK